MSLARRARAWSRIESTMSGTLRRSAASVVIRASAFGGSRKVATSLSPRSMPKDEIREGLLPGSRAVYILFYNLLCFAGKPSFDSPFRFFHVLKNDVDLISGRLPDPHHRVGDRLHDLALLLVGASCVPLDGDVRHAYLLDRVCERTGIILHRRGP